MFATQTLYRKARLLVFAALLLMPAILASLAGTAKAAQVTSRSIRLTTSVPTNSGACTVSCDVTYNVGFTVATTAVIQGIVIDFCSDSPLIGATCTAPTDFDINESTLAIGSLTGISGFTLNAASDTNTVVLTNGSGGSVSAATAVAIPLGTSSSSDGLRNPSTVGTFYARVLTYTTSAGATGYTSASPGTHTDDGGIAMSTARQLTVNARVQEQLEFCVAAIAGTIDTNGEAPANCSATDFNGTNQTVDIGVVDSAAASVSPVATGNGGNDRNGGVMVRTNASNGATISYFAEQASTGTNHLGSLRVSGASCNAGTVSTDQCFDSTNNGDSDNAPTSFATSGEKFGMSIGMVLRPTGSTTTNLTEDVDYDGNGTAAGGFEWIETGTNDPATRLAYSSTVLDYEMLVLNFAARAAATTPTGAYSVTSTYIATATF